MSFRPESDRCVAWKRWLSQHRDELSAAGVPDWIYTDESLWSNFLGEGGWDGESGWCVEMLSPQQAARLHHFLVREYGQHLDRCILRELQIVMNRDRDDSDKLP